MTVWVDGGRKLDLKDPLHVEEMRLGGKIEKRGECRSVNTRLV